MAGLGALLVVVLVADIGRGVGGSRCDVRLLLAVEQSSGLFERTVPGLDDEQVDEHGLEREPAAVDDVVLPAQVAERAGVDVLVEDERERDGEVEDVEALGTEAVGQDLDGVRDDEGREGKTRSSYVSVVATDMM